MAYLDKIIAVSDSTNAEQYVTFVSGAGTPVDPRTDAGITYNPSTDTLTVANLIVNGTTTSINTATLNVSDNIVILNNDVTGTPSEDAGVEVERGTSANTRLLWNETTDRWTFTNDGSNYYNLPTPSEYGIGSGSVTSVALSMPDIFTVSGSPVTTSGTLTASLASQSQNLIFASPNGSSGTPTFRSLVAADIPTLNQSTTGSAGSVTSSMVIKADTGTTEGTDLYTFNGSSAKTINLIGGTNVSIAKAAGSLTFSATDTNYYPTAFGWAGGTTSGPTGSLTGSGMSAVSFGAIPSASVSASGVLTTGAQVIAGSKTFRSAASYDGVTLAGRAGGTNTYDVTLTPTTLTANRILTLPDSAGTVALTSQIPTVSNGTLTLSIGSAAASNNTVTVATGTGFSANTGSNATYQLSIGPALTALASTMTGAGSGFLKKNGADTYAVDTTTYLSGTVTTANGGTGLTSFTAGDMLYYSSGTTLSKLAKGTANQIVGMNNGATAPEYKTVTAGYGVSVTHAANSITIAQNASVTTKTGAYTATSSDKVLLCDATSAGFTITLPAAASSSGVTLTIKKIDSSANAITVDGDSTELIDGSQTIAISFQHQSVDLVCNGTAWYLI